jgi:L-serine deaminase
MQVTWRLMMANTDRGLKPRLGQDGALPGQASGIYRNYLMHLATNPSSAGDYTRASVYATALAEDMLNHFPVITAPTCYGSAIVPAVMRLVQDRFMFTDEKMVEGLAVGGLFGSILLKELNASASPASPQTEIACSAVMAAAGTEYLTGGTMRDIERAASMAAVLFGGAGHQDSPIGQAAFILMNSMVAQGSLPLTDLSGIEPDVLVPRFGDAMHDLFHR